MQQIMTKREEAARLKTVLRVIAASTPRAERADRSLIMLAFASMGLHFPGTAPTKTDQLARCITLLRMHPWMREKAFAYLGGLVGSPWPYIVRQWDRLEALLDAETGCSLKPDVYAPNTFELLHKIVSRRCAKPFCSHPMEVHTYDNGTFSGRCSIPGCACGFYVAPHQSSEE